MKQPVCSLEKVIAFSSVLLSLGLLYAPPPIYAAPVPDAASVPKSDKQKIRALAEYAKKNADSFEQLPNVCEDNLTDNSGKYGSFVILYQKELILKGQKVVIRYIDHGSDECSLSDGIADEKDELMIDIYIQDHPTTTYSDVGLDGFLENNLSDVALAVPGVFSVFPPNNSKDDSQIANQVHIQYIDLLEQIKSNLPRKMLK